MPVTEQEADEAILAFRSEFRGAAHLKIVHKPTQESFYGNKATIDAIGKIKGAFLPRRLDVHLPLANFRDVQDLKESIYHEALGHYGILTFAATQKRCLLDAIIAARQSPSMKEAWMAVDKDYPNRSDLLKAEEVFCLAAEGVGGLPRTAGDDVSRMWLDVVTNKMRLLERDDLQTIADAVADGLRRGVREQQIFPSDDNSQFRG